MRVATHSEAFPTREAAERWCAAYLERWHPCGYGTHTWVGTLPGMQREGPAVWVGYATRSNSCD